MDVQLLLPELLCSVQFTPESVECRSKPSFAAAASFIPSVDVAIDVQAKVDCSVQVTPESVEVGDIAIIRSRDQLRPIG